MTKTDTKAERDAFTLRLRPDLLSFVKQQAEEENRSVPNFVETVLLAEKGGERLEINQGVMPDSNPGLVIGKSMRCPACDNDAVIRNGHDDTQPFR